MSSRKRGRTPLSSSEDDDEAVEAALGLSRAGDTSTLRDSAPRSRQSNSSSNTGTLRASSQASASRSPVLATATAATSHYDPYHHSNVNAQAGPSGLKQTHARRAPPSSRRRRSTSQISDSRHPTPAAARRSTTLRATSTATPCIVISDSHASSDEEQQQPQPKPKKRHKRPRLLEQVDEEAESDHARHDKLIRKLLRADRAKEIREVNRRGASQQQYNGAGAMNEDTAVHAGTILDITLQNFMCHTHFTLSLKSGVNFVTGPNGSGKSAVLAALTLSLGARAVSTGRGASLASFIGHGGDTAHIIIRLTNEGVYAFQPGRLGKVVTIQRTLRKAGSSAFKVTAEDGTVVGTTAGYVSQLTSSWSIRIESPLTLLSQDFARSFLVKSSDSDRWTIWLRSTGLTSVLDNLTALEGSMSQLADTLGRQRPAVKEMRQEEQACKEVVRQATSIEQARSDVGEIEAKLLWREVQDHEKNVHRLDKKAVDAEKDLANLGAGLEETQRVADQASDALQIAEEKRSQLQDESQAAEQAQDEANTSRQQKRATRVQAKASIRDIERDLVGHQREYEEASQQIDHLKATTAARDDRVLEAQTELDELEASREELQGKISAVEDTIIEARDAYPGQGQEDPHLDSITRLEGDLARARGSLTAAKGAVSDPLALYADGRMRQLVEAIDAEARRGGWRGEKPDGPLGRYITVNEAGWQEAVEAVIGATLSAFVVVDAEDQRKLSGLLNRLNVKGVTIIKRQLDPAWKIPESAHPAAQHMTILRAITFQRAGHEQAYRALIDSTSPESVVLVKQRSAGDQLMRYNQQQQTKIRRCISADLFQLGNDRNAGMDKSTALQRPRMLRLSLTGNAGNVQHRIDASQAEVNRLQQALQEARREQGLWRAAQRTAAQVHEQHVQRLQGDRARWRAKVSTSDRRIAELQAVLAEDPPLELEGLQAEAEAAKKAQQYAESQLEASQQAMDVIDRELAHLDNLLQERADAAAKIAQKLRHLAGEMDVLHKSQADSQQALSASTRSSARLEAKIAEARTNVEQARALMEEAVETAEAVSPRLRVDESKEVLQKKLGKLQQQLEQARRLPGFDRDAAEEAYLAAREKVDRAVNSLNSLWFLHRSLTAALDDRRRRWFEMRTQLVSSARMSFQMLMYQKTGKAASLKFKYENLRPNEAEELGIHVDFGHEGKKKAKKIGLEQRSGGERSMTQLYFMMSCWEGAETPFRALDEFNVFLDPSNDAIALETLVKHGLEGSTQYILLTPLSINLPRELSSRIHIVKLKKA